MSESELAVIKPEALKTYIWLQCFDGSIQQVEEEVAMFCPMICQEIVKNGTGPSKNHAIPLPERVNPASLSLILDYCRFHQVPGRSNKERKSFDEKFVRIDTERLCELTSAADSLQLKPLVDLTSRALARIIEGKTPEEIRDIFHLPDDLTEEEKLEPLKNINDDPRIRLLNRLYAKKRKELQERQKLKDVQVQEEQKDERSLDEILCFINGDGDDFLTGSGGGKTAKSKKKNKRRKDSAKNPPKAYPEPVNKEGAGCVVPCKADNGNISILPCQSSDVPDDVEYAFEDADLDDGLDPAMKEELDREVEDFARRLNSVWPERMHFGQDNRIESHIGGNCSLQRFSGFNHR
ncbi:SKP1-like protein 21 isoform X1 [Phragmites australis]|uniref:SKP1-like protein 21 isoform X1 n=1 Tax=Phragmites australis TaxID=29695 RepID=UPI002D7690ED|nr:SKP1-like protein 21 isoform X1 [Phragmites australis]XP_062209550.1 SKP1-like protein 21 isoform X1 [Phragmites australis]